MGFAQKAVKGHAGVRGGLFYSFIKTRRRHPKRFAEASQNQLKVSPLISVVISTTIIPFSCLEDIHMRFMKNYGRVTPYALAYAMNGEFSRVLHQQVEFFSSNPSADTLNRVRSEVGEIDTIMVETIGKILERGDRIELLVDKTGTMQDSAFHFRKQSKHHRRAL